MIKKILQLSALLFLSILIGCEQKFDNVIDNISNDFQTVEVLPVNNINYNSADSLITLSIKFNSSENIQNVFCEVYAPDNSKSNITLFDDGKVSNGDFIKGDNIFSNKIAFGYFSPSGIYNIRYYVTDLSNNTSLVALGSFKYSNGQNNVAPVIFDEEIVPDTLILTGTHLIQVSIHASDENGLSDIDKVYFVVYRPDSSTNNNFNYMFDDGNFSAHGDQVAGDGIYSLRIQIVYNSSTDPQRGTYRFQFQAEDRGGKLSNIINHYVLIQ
jgi:hypothetical protein